MAENSYKNRFIDNPDWNGPEYRIAKRKYELGIYKRKIKRTTINESVMNDYL